LNEYKLYNMDRMENAKQGAEGSAYDASKKDQRALKLAEEMAEGEES
jgi:hypothetical protein